MSNTGKLENDKLFKGLTRPPMLFGVTYTFVILNGMISMMGYIITTNFLFLFVALPGLHTIGYFICFKEPLFIELIMIKGGKCMKCRNRLYHGSNSYDIL